MDGIEAIIALDKGVFAVSQVRFAKQGRAKEFDSATGFFFEHNGQLYFITNRHVVVDENEWFYPDELQLNLHTNANKIEDNGLFSIPLYDGSVPKWFEHPSMGKEIDVVALPIKVASQCHILPFNEMDLIGSKSCIPIGEDLIVIGYPFGIYDSKHNTPIIRSATVASVYLLPYGGKRYFLIDSRLHIGTSGSPVLLKPGIQFHFVPKMNLTPCDRKNKVLIGIHSGQLDEDTNLNIVWYADLILDIINGKKRGAIA